MCWAGTIIQKNIISRESSIWGCTLSGKTLSLRPSPLPPIFVLGFQILCTAFVQLTRGIFALDVGTFIHQLLSTHHSLQISLSMQNLNLILSTSDRILEPFPAGIYIYTLPLLLPSSLLCLPLCSNISFLHAPWAQEGPHITKSAFKGRLDMGKKVRIRPIPTFL